MAEEFDPYYVWLSIPPEQQPPTLYRLLGLRPFEDNLDVIENAADRQMTYLRDFRSGSHSTESQKLLNEVKAAKINLLNSEKKAEYDKLLEQQSVLEDEGSKPDEELSTTLVGFLDLIKAEKARQAAGKKVRKKAKPAEPRRLRRGTATAPAAGQDRRDRTLMICGSVGVGVLLLAVIVVLTLKLSEGPDEKRQEVGGLPHIEKQGHPTTSKVELIIKPGNNDNVIAFEAEVGTIDNSFNGGGGPANPGWVVDGVTNPPTGASGNSYVVSTESDANLSTAPHNSLTFTIDFAKIGTYTLHYRAAFTTQD